MSKPILITLPVEIPVSRVLKRLGYREKGNLPNDRINILIRDELDITRGLMTINGLYGCFPVNTDTRGIVNISDVFRIESKKLHTFLRTCFRVYLLCVTLGPGLDNRVSQLQKDGELSRAVICDAIGSETVEQACARLHKTIRQQETEKGYTTTGRYSPGYGDWRLEDQVAFHQLLKTASIGISLTDRFMMVPQKSISAVTGVCDPSRKQHEKLQR